jgi:hypothetical protein
MPELVMVKTPQIYNRTDGSDPRQVEQVVGITVPGSRTMIEHGYRPTGQEDEEALGLSDYAAARLAEFYERCRVAEPEDRPFYNCHLLAWFISGRAVDLQRYDNYQIARTVPVASTALEPGKTYAIETAEGSLNHSMVGIERPDHSLSVVGDYLPVAIIGNTDLISLYGGVAIKQTIPESASFNT